VSGKKLEVASLKRTPPINEESSCLEIQDLSVRFQRKYGLAGQHVKIVNALFHVNFLVRRGEMLAIAGESGSGKSTLARCILKLTQPTSGTIKFNGADVTKIKGKALQDYRRDVQIVYQDPYESLNPRHSVLTTISLPLTHLTDTRGEAKIREIVASLLTDVGLDPERVMHRYPHELSGGERQRVNIARALASNPKLLVADEPITMLDATQRRNILDLLIQLKQKRNLTVILITHDLASALVSDRILLLYVGRAVELGPSEQVLSKPHHPYAELIRLATPRLERKPKGVRSAQEEYPLTYIEESEKVRTGCVFKPRCKYGTDRCTQAEPPLEEKSTSHFAACYYPEGYE
jgi:oligopeptide/dipeptide ABC transporter ATP-binding protein